MTPLSVALFPDWTALAGAALHGGAGFGAGLLYFGSLWATVQRFAAGGRLSALLALSAGRFAVLALALVAVGFEGPVPLVAAVAGLAAGRHVAIRRVRRMAP